MNKSFRRLTEGGEQVGGYLARAKLHARLAGVEAPRDWSARRDD